MGLIMANTYTDAFLEESIQILKLIDRSDIANVVEVLVSVKARKGRIFFCGSGGGAGHSSHAAADFRKIAGIECYSVSDNISELTARVNDESWNDAYSGWLRASNLSSNDCIFVISVGGGDAERNISGNLVSAIELACEVGAQVIGIAGRDGGELRKRADASILVPVVNANNVTTQVEGFQALIWHLLVCHPQLEGSTPKWESLV
jgi:D-sedoheptulose 7-phosphate isomerase